MPKDMGRVAVLQYSFMFDPSATWQHLYQFEKDLAVFFTSKGMEAQILSTIEGYNGPKILYISKSEAVVEPKVPEEPAVNILEQRKRESRKEFRVKGKSSRGDEELERKKMRYSAGGGLPTRKPTLF